MIQLPHHLLNPPLPNLVLPAHQVRETPEDLSQDDQREQCMCPQEEGGSPCPQCNGISPE